MKISFLYEHKIYLIFILNVVHHVAMDETNRLLYNLLMMETYVSEYVKPHQLEIDKEPKI